MPYLTYYKIKCIICVKYGILFFETVLQYRKLPGSYEAVNQILRRALSKDWLVLVFSVIDAESAGMDTGYGNETFWK